jgi:hypothetical protein
MVALEPFRRETMGMHMIFILVPLLLFALPANAYIGPGAGAGAIAVVLGILASIVMAFFAILWYPIKRLIRRHKAARQGTTGTPESSNRP